MKVLCFDLDGTLIDTWEGERLARLRLLDEIEKHTDTVRELIDGFYDITWAQFKDSYMNMLSYGYGEQEIRAMHLSRVLDELMIKGDPNMLARLHWDIVLDNMYIYPDAEEATRQLCQRYRLTLITNGAGDFQREKLNRLGFSDRFQEIIISGELGYHKPNRKIFNEMTKLTGVDPSEMVYIGDNYSNDMFGAHRAGWGTVWLNKFEDMPDGTEPDWTIKELTELLHLF